MSNGVRTAQRGAALIVSVLLLLFLGLLAAGFITASTSDVRAALHYRSRTAALHAAMGKVELGYQRLTDMSDPRCSSPDQLNITLGSCRVDVSIEPDPANICADSISGWLYAIEAEARDGDAASARVRVQARAVRNTYAGFCYWWQNSEPSWWSETEVTTGPVFVNGCDMYLRDSFSDPRNGSTWYGPVTLGEGGRFILSGDGFGGDLSSYATFYAGYETGATPMQFPPSIEAATGNAGRVFFGQTRIRLMPDGMLRVTNFWAHYDDTPIPIPPSGVIWVRNRGVVDPGNVELAGTLRGRLTIVAEGNGRIVGDVLYSDDPRFNPSSSDMLGVITGSDGTGSGMVGDINPAGVDGDVQVFGFMMSLGTCPLSEWCGALDVENLWNRPYEGTLITLGGQVSDRLSATIVGPPPHGFAADATYDPRGLVTPPPFFPTVEAEGSRWNITKVDSSWTQVFAS